MASADMSGNYNDATAKLYTDVGMLTCAERIGEDATAVFNMLSGYSEPLFWNKLALAPLWLKDKFLHLIEREKNYALEGKNAHIIAKMNSLCDRDIIAALYSASAAGSKCGRREDRTDRQRYLLPEGGNPRCQREYQCPLHRRQFPGA